MRCDMCGYEFDAEACSACGKQGCGECRCPACGYSAPPPSRIASAIRRIRGGARDAQQ